MVDENQYVNWHAVPTPIVWFANRRRKAPAGYHSRLRSTAVFFLWLHLAPLMYLYTHEECSWILRTPAGAHVKPNGAWRTMSDLVCWFRLTKTKVCAPLCARNGQIRLKHSKPHNWQRPLKQAMHLAGDDSVITARTK